MTRLLAFVVTDIVMFSYFLKVVFELIKVDLS